MTRRCRVALVIVMLAALVPSAALAAQPDCTVVGTDGDDIWYVGSGVGNIAATAIVCGGDGNDRIAQSWSYFEGVFYGGDGNDSIFINAGTFYGGDGDDTVEYLWHVPPGTFYGGDGYDTVVYMLGGTFIE